MIVTSDLFSGMWTQNLKDHWNKTENNAKKKHIPHKHPIRIWDVQEHNEMRENNDINDDVDDVGDVDVDDDDDENYIVYWCTSVKLAVSLLGKFTHRSTGLR